MASIYVGRARPGTVPDRRERVAFLASPHVRVVHVDAETAERCAEILVYLRELGAPIPTNDIWIAAAAMQWGRRLLTTDARFGRLPQVSLLGLD